MCKVGVSICGIEKIVKAKTIRGSLRTVRLYFTNHSEKSLKKYADLGGY